MVKEKKYKQLCVLKKNMQIIIEKYRKTSKSISLGYT